MVTSSSTSTVTAFYRTRTQVPARPARDQRAMPLGMQTTPTASAFLSSRPNTLFNPQTPGRQKTVAPGIFNFVRLLLSFLLVSLAWAVPTPSVPPRFESIAKQADLARSQDRVQDAIRLYREGTRLRPSWSEGWWYLGSLLYDQDRFSEADAAFQRLLTSPSHRGPAFAFRGLCEYETGKYDRAVVQFR